MIGKPKIVDPDTSETSSYESDELMEDQVVKKQKKPPMCDEDGDEEGSSYAKFKTQHEMEIEEAYKTGPAYILLDDIDELVTFGSIV
jgi:hypothetical protein